MKTSFPKGSEDPYLNHKKVYMNEFQSLFVTCDSIQDETFEFRSISHHDHTNICHRVFHVLALSPLTLYCE